MAVDSNSYSVAVDSNQLRVHSHTVTLSAEIGKPATWHKRGKRTRPATRNRTFRCWAAQMCRPPHRFNQNYLPVAGQQTKRNQVFTLKHIIITGAKFARPDSRCYILLVRNLRGQIHAATEARDLARAARARPRVRRSHSPRLGCAAHTSPLTITEFRAY